MTPFEKASKLHPDGREFLNVVEAHFQHGRVISTDRVFLLARPVQSDWDQEKIQDPWQFDPDGDCWMAWDVAGDLSVLKEIPASWLQERPKVGFHVNGQWKVCRSSLLLASK